VAGVARKFLGVELIDAGYVLCDGHVARAVRRRRPFVTEFPNSQAAWCLRQVAERLVDGAAQEQAAARGNWFFQRVAGLFGVTA
jgi:flagellar biosynthesis protein FlhG